MGRLTKHLIRKGYKTSGDRAKVYAGFIAPAIAVTSGMYFGVLQGNPVEDPWYMTLGKATISLVTNIPLLPIELGIGGAVATQVLIRRRRSELNKKLDND